MATKKTETKAAVIKETVKPVAEVNEVKAPAAEPVKEEKKAPEVKTEAPKAAAPKKEAAAPKKETAAKKPAAKKAPAKKEPVKKEIKASVYVEYAGKQTPAEELIAAAKKAYLAAGHKEADLKTIEIYMKPEESTAYYVVNGEGSEDYKIVY